jgi:hypothetical protein
MSAPEEDLAINCTAQLQLLEACRAVNPGIAIVHAGRRQIYGRPPYLPVDEQHPLRPVDVNGVNKMAGEAYHLLYHDVYGVKSRSLRLTNVYLREGRYLLLTSSKRIRPSCGSFICCYLLLMAVEEAFKNLKGDLRGNQDRKPYLAIRPVFTSSRRASKPTSSLPFWLTACTLRWRGACMRWRRR